MTVFVSDGFDYGNYNGWTTATSSGTLAVNSASAYLGSNYGLDCSTTGANSYAAIFRSVTAAPVVYHRAYYKFSGMPSSGGSATLVLGGIYDSGYTNAVNPCIRNIGGNLYWEVAVVINGSVTFTTESTASNPTASTWYCIEILRDLTNQTAALWVNGVQKVNATGLSQVNNSTVVEVGLDACDYSTPGSTTCYVDAVVAGNTYNGTTTYNLTIQSGTGGTTDPASGVYTIPYSGKQESVTATAGSGYTFTNWLVNGSNAGSTNPYTITMNNNYTIQPVFSGGGGGSDLTVTGNLTVQGNATIGGTISAQGGGVFNGFAIGTGQYGSLPYPYETIQLNSNWNLRFNFGTTERAALTSGGQLQLSTPGSSGGLLFYDVSLYREQYINTLNTNASYFNVAGGIKAHELQIEVPNWNDIIIYGIAGMQTGDDPVLYLSNASLLTDNDVLVYGSIGAVTDPNKATGGGVVIIGHGWTDTSDYPAILLTDYPSGSGFNTLWLRYSTGTTPSQLSETTWANLACGTITSAGSLYLTGNTNGYLWNNGGYIRQSGGYGFVADGYVVVGTLGSGNSGPLYLDGQHKISYYSSAQRYKENIESLTDCSWLYNLRPVKFDWKDPDRKVDGRQMGLIAEEVNAICPQLAWTGENGKPEGVHYEWLGVPILVELQKLKREVDKLKAKLSN